MLIWTEFTYVNHSGVKPMRMFVVGTVLVISCAVLVLVLKVVGVPNTISLPISIGVAVIGFAMQLYAAISMKRKFEQEMLKAAEEQHSLLLHVSKLPPAEAIAILLRGK